MPYVSGKIRGNDTHERQFKYFFRTTPSSRTQAQDFFTFLREVNKAGGTPVKTVAIVSENTLWGQEFAKSAEGYFKDFPITLATKVAYRRARRRLEQGPATHRIETGCRLSPRLLRRRGDHLFAKTYKSFGFQPRGIMAIGAAFGSGAFRNALGRMRTSSSCAPSTGRATSRARTRSSRRSASSTRRPTASRWTERRPETSEATNVGCRGRRDGTAPMRPSRRSPQGARRDQRRGRPAHGPSGRADPLGQSRGRTS